MALRHLTLSRYARLAVLAALVVAPVSAGCGGGGAHKALHKEGTATGDCAQPNQTDVSQSPSGWRLVVSDAFRSDTLQHCWRPYLKNSGSGNPLSSMVKVGGGYLTLFARGKDTGAVGLDMPPRQYGRYDFRACTYLTRGSWSGIFLWPSGQTNSEIDMMEAANERNVWFNMHWGSNAEQDQKIAFPQPGKSAFNTDPPEGPQSCNQWHTWSFEWTPTALTLSMDGRQVVHNTRDDIVKIFSQPMSLLMEMEPGPPGNEWSNGAPADDSVSAMYVDWVKVYDRTG